MSYNVLQKEVLRLGKTDAQIGLRTTREFKARLEAQAARERRNVSNLIIKVMEEYLEKNEPKEEAE